MKSSHFVPVWILTGAALFTWCSQTNAQPNDTSAPEPTVTEIAHYQIEAELEDLVEDAPYSPGLQPDVRRVGLHTDGKTLRVTCFLAPGWTERVAKGETQAETVATLKLDIDDDRTTGSHRTWQGVFPGFEYEVPVYACAGIKENGVWSMNHACHGLLTISGVESARSLFSSFGLSQFPQGDGNPKRVGELRPEYPERRGTVEGDVVVVNIPYQDLGLTAGSTVRISIQDAGAQSSPDDGYLPDVRLTVR